MAATTPGSPPQPPAGGVLRMIAWAMAAGLFALLVVALAVRPAGDGGLPPLVVWTIGGLALGNLLIGVLLAVTADPDGAGYRSRVLVSLALREAAGLLGAIPTLLGGDVAWALGLGGAAVVSLLVLLPRREPPR